MVDVDSQSIERLIRQTLLKVQIKPIRERYYQIIKSNSDMGAQLEWSAPVARAVMGRTIEIYEGKFNAQPIANDAILDEMVAVITEALLTTDAPEISPPQPTADDDE